MRLLFQCQGYSFRFPVAKVEVGNQTMDHNGSLDTVNGNPTFPNPLSNEDRIWPGW